MNRYVYDYKKVFFRRPRWTADNILFGKVLTITAVVCITITAMLTTIYHFRPDTRLVQSTRISYINRLANIYEMSSRPLLASVTSDVSRFVEMAVKRPPTVDIVQPPVEEPPVEEPPVEDSQPQPRRLHVFPMVKIATPAASSMLETIDRVEINKNPTPPGSLEKMTNLAGYRSQAREYQRNQKQLNRNSRKVSIAAAAHTDFEIIKGYRNDEKTLAVASNNHKLLQHCFDDYYNTFGNIQGYIVVRFDIHPNGYIIPGTTKVIESTLPDPRFAQCIVRNIRRWRNFERLPIEMGRYSLTQKYVF